MSIAAARRGTLTPWRQGCSAGRRVHGRREGGHGLLQAAEHLAAADLSDRVTLVEVLVDFFDM